MKTFERSRREDKKTRRRGDKAGHKRERNQGAGGGNVYTELIKEGEARMMDLREARPSREEVNNERREEEGMILEEEKNEEEGRRKRSQEG